MEFVLAAIPHTTAALGVAHAETVIPFIDVQTATGHDGKAAQHTQVPELGSDRCSASPQHVHNKASCTDDAVFELHSSR